VRHIPVTENGDVRAPGQVRSENGGLTLRPRGGGDGSVFMTEDLVRIVGADRVLETSRCLLRRPESSDVSRALSAFTSQSFPREVPLGQLSSPQEVLKWIEGAQARWAEGSAYTWTIMRNSDRMLVGQVSLSRTPDPGRWALAFWTHPECWGEGYATEAAERIVAFAFGELGATVVWAGAARWNRASRHILKRLGMVHVSDNPRGYVIRGKPIPTKEYEISRNMWQTHRPGLEREADPGR
jgi:ribosomal-protein-alanine N-acetyltransferase